jgi:hypothetical protein
MGNLSLFVGDIAFHEFDFGALGIIGAGERGGFARKALIERDDSGGADGTESAGDDFGGH